MHKRVSEYLDALCAPIRSKETRLTARAEFAGHIGNIVEELRGKGESEEEAVRQALERMGDPAEVGVRIAGLGAPRTNLFMALGGLLLLILAFVFLGTFLPLIYLLDFHALAFVGLVTAALVLIGGVNRFTHRTALDRMRFSALYAGAVGTIAGAINSLGNIGDYEALGPALAFCVTSLLYGVLVSAVTGSLAHLTRPIGPEEIGAVCGRD